MSQPYFALDGPDGAGKSTILPKLQKHLEERGNKVLLVKEPGQTEVGRFIRNHVLASDLGFQKNLEFFIADRILTNTLVVKPALEAGYIVLSDRSYLSTVVYQGFAEDQVEEILKLHKKIPGFLYPTCAFVAQLDLAECKRRLGIRHQEGDKLNHMDLVENKVHEDRHRWFNQAHEWADCPVSFLDFSQSDAKIFGQVYEVMRIYVKDQLK